MRRFIIKMVNKTGRAYAFFDCGASKEEIEEELPYIRDAVRTPNDLELSLKDTKNLTGLRGILRLTPLKLSQIAKKAKGAEIKYVRGATYPNATNKQTADELADILNQSYQSPLYEDGEQFRGEVVYEDSGRYIFRE